MGGYFLTKPKGAVSQTADRQAEAPSAQPKDTYDALRYLTESPITRRPVSEDEDFDLDAIVEKALWNRQRLRAVRDKLDELRQQIREVEPWGDFKLPSPDELGGLGLWFYVVPLHKMKLLEEANFAWHVVRKDHRNAVGSASLRNTCRRWRHRRPLCSAFAPRALTAMRLPWYPPLSHHDRRSRLKCRGDAGRIGAAPGAQPGARTDDGLAASHHQRAVGPDAETMVLTRSDSGEAVTVRYVALTVPVVTPGGYRAIGREGKRVFFAAAHGNELITVRHVTLTTAVVAPGQQRTICSNCETMGFAAGNGDEVVTRWHPP